MGTGTIDAGKLRKELEASWRSVGKVEAASDAGVLRACSMTFIVLTDEADDAQLLGESLAHLNQEYPSRTIVVRGCSNPNRPMEGRVLVQCWRPAGKRQQICCEQIELMSAQTRTGELDSVILGLMVPDLPVVILCRHAPSLSSPLLELAHKVILDDCFPSAQEALAAVHSLLGRKFEVADLAWTRITRWREMLNRIFHHQKLRGRAGEVREIEVTYAGPQMPATACYLAAWLLQMFSSEGSLVMRAVEDEPGSPYGKIRSVRLSGPSIDVSLVRPAGTHATVKADGFETAVLFPQQTQDELLRQEAGLIAHDEVFHHTLEMTPTVLECVQP